MIQRLYVNNYKCLVNFELRLEELSLLLGPSGAGKTAVLDIMLALRRLLSGVARVTDADVFPTRTLTRWQARDLQVFEIQARLEAETLTYRLEVEHERASKKARICLEKLVADGGPLFECLRGEVKLYRDDHSSGPEYSTDWSESALARVASRGDNIRLTRFLEFMRGVLVCGFSPPTFRTESSAENVMLERDAHNFADWYRHALQERRVVWSDPLITRSGIHAISGRAGQLRRTCGNSALAHGARRCLWRGGIPGRDNFASSGVDRLPWLRERGPSATRFIRCCNYPSTRSCRFGCRRPEALGVDRQRLGEVSRRVQIVLLCEDLQQRAFACRFLRGTGWKIRSIRVEMAPKGRGSAEKYVRKPWGPDRDDRHLHPGGAQPLLQLGRHRRPAAPLHRSHPGCRDS